MDQRTARHSATSRSCGNPMASFETRPAIRMDGRRSGRVEPCRTHPHHCRVCANGVVSCRTYASGARRLAYRKNSLLPHSGLSGGGRSVPLQPQPHLCGRGHDLGGMDHFLWQLSKFSPCLRLWPLSSVRLCCVVRRRASKPASAMPGCGTARPHLGGSVYAASGGIGRADDSKATGKMCRCFDHQHPPWRSLAG